MFILFHLLTYQKKLKNNFSKIIWLPFPSLWCILQLARSQHQSHHRSPCGGPWGFGSHEVAIHQIGIGRCLERAEYAFTYILSLAVCIHEFLELSATFDLEKDLLAVLNIRIITWLFTLRLSCSALVAGCSAIWYRLYRIGSTSK